MDTDKIDRTRRSDPHSKRQVVALIGGPAAVLLTQQAQYLLVAPACASGHLAPLHLAALIGVLGALACGALAFREWRLTGGGWPDHEGGSVGRTRFMGVLAMLMAASAALVMIAQWIPDWIVSPCQH
jgi:hypothetical protein